MKDRQYIGLFFSLGIVLAAGCRQSYNPPLIQASHNYLVVSGFLNSGNDSTIITLSRTRNLGDSLPPSPELNASVEVLGENGELFPLSAMGNGVYAIPSLGLITGNNYQLQIITSTGEKYLSDPVPVKYSPPIDSVSWRQDTTSADNKLGVNIYVTTHDPNNNTLYYRWDYDETWEYHSPIESFYEYRGGVIVARAQNEFTYACWTSRRSTDLTLANSAKLSQDLIFENPIRFIAAGDQKLSVRYSILVRQYAMTKEAYDYWENLKKNTELTGSIFDPQPSQVTGNIHSVTVPEEPVLGYISASSVQQQRIFIDNTSLEHWGYVDQPGGCVSHIVSSDSVDYYFSTGNYYVPVSQYVHFPRIDWYAALPDCVNCLSHGGINVQPLFW